jgi:ATP-dependent DNA helicase DinG
VPEVATDHGGLRISSYGTDRLLKYLYNPRTKRGLLQRHGGPAEGQLVVDALDAAQLFFEHLATRILRDKSVLRLLEPGFADPLLDEPLDTLWRAVRRCADRLDEGRDRDELLEQVQRLKTYQAAIRQFLDLAEADKQVYWLERTGRRQTIVALRAAPIDIAPFLREHLFTRHTSVVLTSATLAVAGQLDPLRARLGATEVTGTIVHSPFDYARHMRVYVATDVPIPTGSAARLDREVLIDYIDFCTRRVSGGSLVLFTSYQDMRAVAAAMEPIYDGARRPFFLQGRDHSSTELARQLRAEGNGVLFGTDSFWTGVDIPGDALSQVIITRLPFEVPTHPVLEARTEWVRARGGRPFEEITLPDALMKFRQGVGRLIRTASDRGIVTVLDSRVVQKAYGRLFLDSLPVERPQRINRRNRLEIFRPFT